MNERKQSFLERLTGSRALTEDELHQRIDDDPRDQPNPKQWSPSIDRDESDTPDQPTYRIDVQREVEDQEEEEEPGLAIDMYETDNELVIQSMIAGVTPEHLQISITRDVVMIKGRRNESGEIPDDRYIARELYWGPFSREITLPFEIDTDGAEAVEKYGLLIIRLPKLDTARTQELKVKSI